MCAWQLGACAAARASIMKLSLKPLVLKVGRGLKIMVFPAAACSPELETRVWLCEFVHSNVNKRSGLFVFWGTVAGNGQQQQPVKCCDPVSDRLQAAGRAVLQPRCVWLWTSARSEGNLGADILLVREDFQRRTRYVYLLFIDVFIYYRRLDGWFKTGRWQVADVWV